MFMENLSCFDSSYENLIGIENHKVMFGLLNAYDFS